MESARGINAHTPAARNHPARGQGDASQKETEKVALSAAALDSMGDGGNCRLHGETVYGSGGGF